MISKAYNARKRTEFPLVVREVFLRSLFRCKQQSVSVRYVRFLIE